MHDFKESMSLKHNTLAKYPFWFGWFLFACIFWFCLIQEGSKVDVLNAQYTLMQHLSDIFDCHIQANSVCNQLNTHKKQIFKQSVIRMYWL